MIEAFAHAVRSAVADNGAWMSWNLTLALVPAALATAVFRSGHWRVARWVGACAFVLFLPNAPYVLTDVIHFLHDVRSASDRYAVFVVMPMYALFALIGFGAYVGSLALVRRHLRAEGRRRWVWPVETALHLASAVGIHLGRFGRANSWDVLVPSALHEPLVGLLQPWSMVLVAVTFGALALLGWVGLWLVEAVAQTVELRWSSQARAASATVGRLL